MKDFIKFTFASCLGVFLAGIVFFIFFSILIGVLISAAGGAGSKPVVAKGSVLALDFSQPIPEQTNNVSNTSFAFHDYDVPGIHDVAGLIRHAAEDDKIEGILIENGISALGSSSAQIIQDALLAFRESDKFIAAYGDYYTQQGYYLASSADYITLHPVGTVDFRGFASYSPFFKGLLDKIGLDFQIYYAGDFKSATEPLRRTEMSPENKLQIREYLTDAYTLYLEDVADARKIQPDELKRLAYEFQIKKAEDALQYKLVDALGAKADCETWINEKLGKPHESKVNYISMNDYAATTPASPINFKAKDKIAIVYAEGDIVSGRNEYGVIDDGRYVKLLKEIRRQEDIKAVVLRINSPGGSILSAENIYRQLVGLQEDGKKLVVSMGDYAASGGYYLSAMADSIFAQSNTLTGSIGVFSVIPNPSGMLKEKLGVTFDTVRTGPYSTDFTLMFPWSEREDQYMQERTEAYYKLFLEKVADGRDMTYEQVDEIAQGRIWSGRKAVELKLVDKIGTLDDAVEAAATLAGISEYRVKEYPVFQNQLQKFFSDIMDDQQSQTGLISKSGLPDILNIWHVIQSGEPQARLPFGFSVSNN